MKGFRDSSENTDQCQQVSIGQRHHVTIVKQGVRFANCHFVTHINGQKYLRMLTIQGETMIHICVSQDKR